MQATFSPAVPGIKGGRLTERELQDRMLNALGKIGIGLADDQWQQDAQAFASGLSVHSNRRLGRATLLLALSTLALFVATVVLAYAAITRIH